MTDMLNVVVAQFGALLPLLFGFGLIASIRPARALGRLINARIATGHWPSQDPEARRIYLGENS